MGRTSGGRPGTAALGRSPEGREEVDGRVGGTQGGGHGGTRIRSWPDDGGPTRTSAGRIAGPSEGEAAIRIGRRVRLTHKGGGAITGGQDGIRSGGPIMDDQLVAAASLKSPEGEGDRYEGARSRAAIGTQRRCQVLVVTVVGAGSAAIQELAPAGLPAGVGHREGLRRVAPRKEEQQPQHNGPGAWTHEHSPHGRIKGGQMY